VVGAELRLQEKPVPIKPRGRSPFPASAPNAEPKPGVVQPFWLQDKDRTTWVTNQTMDLDKFRDTGKTQWWSSWLPPALNWQVPVYERRPTQPQKRVTGKKPKPTVVEQELTDSEWESGVKNTLHEWSNHRGGMVDAPEDWEYRELWGTRPGGFRGQWDSWMDLRNFYRHASGVERPLYLATLPKPKKPTGPPVVKIARPEGEIVNEIVDEILGRIRGAIGRYPVWGSKEKPARKGCVMFGPSASVPPKYADLVYQAFLAMEGHAFHGGRLHVVNKVGFRQYNITLHGDYRAFNPKTRVNMHIDNSG
jgi:hypothetical protein